jgi:hypothetical protein
VGGISQSENFKIFFFPDREILLLSGNSFLIRRKYLTVYEGRIKKEILESVHCFYMKRRHCTVTFECYKYNAKHQRSNFGTLFILQEYNVTRQRSIFGT